MKKDDKDQQINKAIDVIKLLTHLERIKIVLILNKYGQLRVYDIEQQLAIKQSMLSHHLGRMTKHGIIKGQRRGRETYYSLSDSMWNDIINQIISRGWLPGCLFLVQLGVAYA